MFIQVIQGRCTRQDELRTALDRWREDLGPTAHGWLGGTYGFADDDQFIGVVRFEDRDKAMANSDRVEQSEWAEELRALFDGPVEFHDSDDVTLLFDGGSDHAGFVQVIRGRVEDPDRLRALMTRDTELLHRMRPEILGATLALEPDGTFTETVAFTDEESARRGEQLEPPEEIRTELQDVMQGATFYDLHQPWFDSTR